MPDFVNVGSIFRRLLEAGPIAVGGVALVIMAVVLIMVMRARLLAMVVLIFAMCFSLFGGGLGVTAVAARWLAIIVLVPLGLPGLFQQGRVMGLLWIYVILLMFGSVRAVDFFWSLQKGGALALLMISLPGTLALYLSQPNARPEKLLRWLLLLACIWAGVNILPLRSHLVQGGIARYTGEAESPGLNALVMGLLLPIAVWGALRKGRLFVRVASGLSAAALTIVLLFGATRGGAFMGAIACIPMLLKISAKRLVQGALVVGLVGVAAMAAINYAPREQREFILERYSGQAGKSTFTGRAYLWKEGLEECLKDPWFGKGAGSAGVHGELYLSGHGFHNAYLIIWFGAGILGLTAFLLAIGVSVRRGFAVVRRCRRNPQEDLTARLMLGSLLGLAAVSMFEGTLSSSTNFVVGMFLVYMTMLNYAWKQAHQPATAAIPPAHQNRAWSPAAYPAGAS